MSAIWSMAAADLGRAFQQHSRRGGGWSDAAWFVAFVLIAIGFFVVLHFWDRIAGAVGVVTSKDQTLFDELCKTHRMTDSDRDMLTNAIQNASIAQPAYVFVDRSILANYAKQKGAPRKTCAALIRKLFGDE